MQAEEAVVGKVRYMGAKMGFIMFSTSLQAGTAGDLCLVHQDEGICQLLTHSAQGPFSTLHRAAKLLQAFYSRMPTADQRLNDDHETLRADVMRLTLAGFAQQMAATAM